MVELEVGGLIRINDRELGLRETFELLEGVAQERSVRGAAERLKLSYRSAWGRIASLEAASGRALVVKTKGHGTTLTELGEELRSNLQSTLRSFDAPLAREQRALDKRLAQLFGARRKLRIAASHDPRLLETLGGRDDVEVSTMGSEAALDRLMSGQVDVAGCHFGPSDGGTTPASLRQAGIAAEAAFEREQGLIVARGSPFELASVADVARTGARFINRQRGSGTRAWFDRMLAAEGIVASTIVGYGVEEFTHQAVAAVVASGAADVGFGVRAAAEAFGLPFVPLGKEIYYLVRRAGFASAALDEILAALRIGNS
jgi:molybdate transport repressor ModE-like protein